MICIICIIYAICDRANRAHVYHVQEGFLRSTVVYLKDLSPYLRQFLPCSNSQNTIRVNLLGNPTPLVVKTLLTILYLYTQPISAPTVVLLLGVVTQLLLRLQQKKSNNMLPTIELTIPQLYTIELELPPKINKLITTAYNTSINLLLY